MDEVSKPESRSGSLEGEAAKWQDRVIRISCESPRLKSAFVRGIVAMGWRPAHVIANAASRAVKKCAGGLKEAALWSFLLADEPACCSATTIP